MNRDFKNLLKNIFYRIQVIPCRFLGNLLFYKKLTIISAADSSHYRSLLQLINSIKSICPRSFILKIYDLGLTEGEIKHFRTLHPEISLMKFDYSNYPSFFNIRINAGEYAWKSAIFKLVYDEQNQGSFILWLDAGCFIRRKLYLIKGSLMLFGFYSPLSGPSIKNFTHPTTIDILDLLKFQDCKMISSGVVGMRKNLRNNKLVDDWYKFSLKKEIIAPEHSDKSNHRQDQSLLSLLLYANYKIKKQPFYSQKWMEILPHMDID